jgi:hypothetical protein
MNRYLRQGFEGFSSPRDKKREDKYLDEEDRYKSKYKK